MVHWVVLLHFPDEFEKYFEIFETEVFHLAESATIASNFSLSFFGGSFSTWNVFLFGRNFSACNEFLFGGFFGGDMTPFLKSFFENVSLFHGCFL